MNQTYTPKPPWPYHSAEYRWYGFGRYYAMFPPSFAYNAVLNLTRRGETVLDPFCGRGNGPFTASVLVRPSVGIDINPIAWLFTSVKLCPEGDMERLLRRLRDVARARTANDRKSRSQFETMAWAPSVRALLRAARRELNWKEKGSITDRTLMAFISLHMQDKLGAGLSNSLWPTIACSPQYAVSWWSKNGFNRPPEIDPVALLSDKIQRRYRYGIPEQVESQAILSDAKTALEKKSPINAKLLITSPPYVGVTDYWNDHWLRLWLLGHSMKKNWKRSEKYENREAYQSLINDTMQEACRHLSDGAAILIRSDQRTATASACIRALQTAWPNRKIFVKTSTAPHNGVSVHHGRGGNKAQEFDLLIPGKRGRFWLKEQGFKSYPEACNSCLP